jgi:hypothetical protein
LLIGAVALALLGTMLLRRIYGMLWKALVVLGTCLTAAAFLLAYRWIG